MLLEDADLRAIQRLARRRGMTTAEWVRQALRVARQAEAGRDPREKLEAIRLAARHSFPASDVESILDEIEQGYRQPG